MVLQLPLFVFILHGCFGSGSGTSNSSAEHLIRQALLTDYDKAVIPKPLNGSLNVMFGLKIKKLIKVDNKEQVLTIDTWIIMKWSNSFLKWDKKRYGGVEMVQFAPTEIWFPDISLYNNGDEETPRAGGTNKFLSDVHVRSNGVCIWSGPASFKADCEMKLETYPFDHQSCQMNFGSYNYASNKLRLEIFKTKQSKSDRFIESGDWTLRSVRPLVGQTDHGHCCPYKFSEIRYTVEMTRRFMYHLFYLVAPCAIISILVILSFCIPTESGERIGFVTTLLLGMMVFLLIIPESLPESSKSIPVLGILMMLTLVVIGLVLLVTILILKCFHSKREPPEFLRQRFGRTKSHREAVKTHPQNTGDGVVVENINLRASLPHSQGQDFKPPLFEAFHKNREADNEATWQYISRVCDKIMFFVFLILTIIMYAVTMTYRDE